MTIYNKRQQEIGNEIEHNLRESQWKDWQWHIKHAIKDIPLFEKLTGITFSEQERKTLHNTIARFPVSITPYYLSLIERVIVATLRAINPD